MMDLIHIAGIMAGVVILHAVYNLIFRRVQ